MHDKIISRVDFSKIREKFREENKKVVLCHGVFDLLHYGHIEHLQEAKNQGDILVVSVTAAKYVNKGPGRPYFNDQQRMTFLSSLEFVDYVILSEAVTVHNVVEHVQPDVYVKGQEYAAAENDVTGNIASEQAIVEKYGGRIYFTRGEVYSSTKLLNNFFGALPEDVIESSRRLREKYGDDVKNVVRDYVNSFQNLKVLVIGDVIIDDYIFCKVQGLTMKDAVMSTRYSSNEKYLGGSLAVARHLANFSDHVTLLSMMGTNENLYPYVVDKMKNVNCCLLQDPDFITPIKRRYLRRHALRQEYEKFFSVNYLLEPEAMDTIDRTKFYEQIEKLCSEFDLIVVCDYGHGLLDKKAIELIENKAKFLAVNCQTNSANHGLNIITKYNNIDSFVVDDQELNLASGQFYENKSVLLKNLHDRLHSKYSWLTLGANGALGITDEEESQIPAVTLHVKDTVGAGDAFYSLASLCAVQNIPIDLATLVGNVAGAIKTNLVGNSKPVSKVDLLKFLDTILNV